MTNPVALPEENLADSSRLVWLSWALAGALIYFLTARIGMALFSLRPGNITLLWLPSGIGLILYLRLGWRVAPAIFLASLFANLPGMFNPNLRLQWLCTGILSFSDALAPLLSALLIQTYLPRGLQRVQDLAKFTLYACIMPTLFSSVLMALDLAFGRYLNWNQLPGFILTLLVSDSLGILLVYFLYTSWKSRREEETKALTRQALIALSTILSLRLLAYDAEPSLIFFIVPVLLYLVFSASALLVSASTTFTVALIVAASTRNLGPFDVADKDAGARMLVVFLFSTTLVVMGMQLQRKELMAENADRKEWERKAGYDALTGLANRQLFVPMLTNEVERAQRNAVTGSFCLGLIDIDHFKSINDNYGHPVGDKVLESIAQTMLETLRSMDVPARYGGEEFAILFPSTSLNKAADAMERLRANIERTPVRTGKYVIPITVSGGLAEFGHHIKTVEDLIQTADSRLYAAKRGGRNQVMLEPHRARHC